MAAAAQPRPKMIPPGWQEVREDPQWRGRRFVSPDGSAWFAVSAAPAADRSLREHMDRVAYREGERITYQRRTRGFIAVSGFKGDRIFYRRANLACGGTRWHHIALEYPAEDKRKMDALVTHISHGLQHYDDDCRPRR
jgi:serine/threonine-protein kinase